MKIFESEFFLFIKKYVIFMIGGALGLGINFCITIVLTDIFKIWYLWSFIMGGLVNITFNFYYNRHITFNVTDKPWLRYGKVIITNVGYSAVNAAMFYFAVDKLKINYRIAMILVMAILSLINFLVNKLWVFKRRV